MRVVVTIAAALLALTVAAEPQQPKLAPAGSIEGVVLDKTTDLALSGVRVTLYLESTAGRGTTATSDAQGRFVFKALASGNYQVTTSREGYAPARPEERKSPGTSGLALSLADDQELKDLVIRLKPGSVITGRVFDSNGAPVRDARVGATRLSYNESGEKTFLGSGGRSATDDRGEFRIFDLDPGEYYILIRGPDYMTRPEGKAYGNVYYPGVADGERAEPVSVRAGEELRLGDMSIPVVKTVPVRLNIVNESGAQPATIRTIAFGLKGGDTLSIATTSQRYGGPDAVELAGLPPGTNTVSVGWQTPDGYVSGATTIEVGAEERLTGVIAVRKGARLTGRAVLEAPDGTMSPLQGLGVRITSSAASNPGGVNATTGADGTFSWAIAPGTEYRLALSGLPEEAYVIRAEQDGHDVLSNTGLISGDSHIEIVAGSGGGILNGAVKDGAGKSMPGAMVVLIPEPSLRHRRELYRNAISDQDGKFVLHSVPPGTYKLFAWMEAEGAGPFRNAEFMKKYEERGKEIQIARGQHATAEIQPADHEP